MRYTITSEPILLQPKCNGDICSIWNIGIPKVQVSVYSKKKTLVHNLYHGGYISTDCSFTDMVWLYAPDGPTEVVVMGFEAEAISPMAIQDSREVVTVHD